MSDPHPAQSLNQIPPHPEITSVGIGFFDGVHLGHQQIFREVLAGAKGYPRQAAVITFEPHPLQVISPEKAPQRLTTAAQKIHWIHHYGIENILVLSFDQSLRHSSPEDFIGQLAKILPNLRTVTVGSNWRFGYKGSGNAEILSRIGAQYHWEVQQAPTLHHQGEAVSSTRIREAISRREFSLAEKLLGHPFALTGTVVHGDGRGKSLGFPTANIGAIEQIVPPPGVYAVTLQKGSLACRGVLNHGTRPTFHSNGKPILEVHLLDFSGDLYDTSLSVGNWHYLREERSFSSPEELRQQIFRDIAAATAELTSPPNLTPLTPSGQ